MKKCKRCDETKALNLFPRNAKTKDGRASYCLGCMSAYARQYRYGITKEQYDAMMFNQNFSCAVCREPFSDKLKPNVDHDHNCCPGKVTCGECVRGILCSGCNAFAGLIETRFSIHEAMFTYLHLHLESKNSKMAMTEMAEPIPSTKEV